MQSWRRPATTRVWYSADTTLLHVSKTFRSCGWCTHATIQYGIWAGTPRGDGGVFWTFFFRFCPPSAFFLRPLSLCTAAEKAPVTSHHRSPERFCTQPWSTLFRGLVTRLVVFLPPSTYHLGPGPPCRGGGVPPRPNNNPLSPRGKNICGLHGLRRSKCFLLCRFAHEPLVDSVDEASAITPASVLSLNLHSGYILLHTRGYFVVGPTI